MLEAHTYMSRTALPFGGVRTIVSEHATAEPSGRPFTDDMKRMIETLRKHGEIKRRPACYQTTDAMIIHPVLMERLKSALSSKVDEMAFDALTGNRQQI